MRSHMNYYVLGAVVLLAATGLSPGCPVLASENTELPMTAALTLPATARGLTITLKQGDLVVKHEDRDNIEIRTNYPDHFNVDDDGLVEQSRYAICPFGIYRTQNGNTYMGQGTSNEKGGSIKMTPSGVFLNGKKLKTEKRRSRPGHGGLEMNGQGIFIDGKRVKTNQGTGKESELDCVQVLLPKSYSGTLKLKTESKFPLDIDAWEGDSLSIEALGNGSIRLGQLNCNTTLNSTGTSSITAKWVGQKDLNADIEGTSNFEAEVLEGTSVTFKLKGEGKAVTKEGTLSKLNVVAAEKSRLDLTGSDSSKPIRVSDCTLEAQDTANLNSYNIVVSHGTVKNAGTGEVRLSGKFLSLKVASDSKGSVTVENPE